MKTKWVVIIILIVILGVLFYLNQKGIIHWQALTILAAAMLGPFKFIASFFKSDQAKIDEINAKHAAVREQETKYQQAIADNLKEHDKKIDDLNKNNDALNDKLKSLDDQRNAVAGDVHSMSIEVKEDEARGLLED